MCGKLKDQDLNDMNEHCCQTLLTWDRYKDENLEAPQALFHSHEGMID